MSYDVARMERGFNPKTVAVVGDKKGHENYMWLRSFSTFQGKLYSVQIDPNEIPAIEAMGVPNYLSLLDIPEPVDYVLVAVPRAVAPKVLADCIKKDVGMVTLFTSGFAETGTEDGARLQEVITRIAREANLHLVGPNCMGICNPQIGLRFSPHLHWGEGGPMSFVSQSGTQATGFTLEAHSEGINVSKVVSFGNAAVLDSPDFLEYFSSDDAVRVIGMYVEGVKDGRRFFRTLRRVASQRIVLVWKGGQTEDSSRAIRSHTAALAVSSAIWNAMIRQCGAIQVESLEEMIDTCKAVLCCKPGAGNRVGLIAISGGHSVEMADAFTRADLRVTDLSDESYARLSAFYKIIGGSYRNPIEGGGNWESAETLVSVLDILDRDPRIDAIAVEWVANAMRRNPGLAEQWMQILTKFRDSSSKPFMVMFSPYYPKTDPEIAKEINLRLVPQGVPTFVSFRRAATAMKKLLDYYSSRKEQGD